MSIRSSRVLGQLHPWLRERVEFLEALTNHFQGTFLYFSGYRTRAEQNRLFINRVPLKPVAAPGCSQHNHFGPNGATLAVDVGIFGSVSQEGFTNDEFNRGINAWAHHVGLTTVSRDPGHFQVFPGSEFKAWAVASGFCNPNPPPLPLSSLIFKKGLLYTPITVGGDRSFFGVNPFFTVGGDRRFFGV